jgi:hypothetical protein
MRTAAKGGIDMARSVGVTISAVVVFIGSGLTLLLGAMAILSSLFLLHSDRVSSLPVNPAYIVFVEAIFCFGFGGGGLASGVGLITTKEWARISTVVFAALLVFFSLPPALFMGFIPIPVPNDASLAANFATGLRVGMVLFFAIFAALGCFWLYFFNKASVKAQFQAREAVLPQPLSTAPAGAISGFSDSPPAAAANRVGGPLSIAIIGWLLLIGSLLAPFSLWYYRGMFPGMPLPMCFMGFFFVGPTAVLFFAIWVAVQIVAAIGLLKLKNWARLATIALQGLGILNLVLLAGIPANRMRFQQLMDAAMASLSARLPQPVSFTFPAWIAMAASLPAFVVILWFLITRKQAFVSAAPEPMRPL